MDTRGGREERKGNCLEILPQLVPRHWAVWQSFFPSVCPAEFSPIFLLLFNV